ncbi:MAG TPA: hypothetical protein VKU38_12150 [Ktedonobacteraceae bacterium]|nr:hypothetical protein [Ktedonobacteraceae bacterium]
MLVQFQPDPPSWVGSSIEEHNDIKSELWLKRVSVRKWTVRLGPGVVLSLLGLTSSRNYTCLTQYPHM